MEVQKYEIFQVNWRLTTGQSRVRLQMYSRLTAGSLHAVVRKSHQTPDNHERVSTSPSHSPRPISQSFIGPDLCPEPAAPAPTTSLQSQPCRQPSIISPISSIRLENLTGVTPSINRN